MKKKLPVILFLLFLILVGKPQAFAQSFESPTTSPAPKGQIVKLDFSIPGIGSDSGNLAPLRKQRNTVLYFYAPDANSSDPNVKPITSFVTQASFDDDPASATYGSFINQNIDLGTQIADGRYQIRFKTDQALSHLVKQTDSAVGGKVFEVNKSYGQPINITGQIVITGDIYPSLKGDNLINSNDSHALNSCFGEKANTSSCIDKEAADLDDNGKIDGTDYNLMAGSINRLKEMGLYNPSIVTTPVVTPKNNINKIVPSTSVIKENENSTSKKSGKPINIFMIFFIIFILIDIIVGAIIVINKRKRKNLVEKITKIADDSSPSTENLTTSSGVPIDKDYYVKKQADDQENKRILLSLTDDSGPTIGYYAGTAIKDGFARVKGVLKKEGDKSIIEVEKISTEESTDTPS